jgi:cytoskeletal protein CcmA (bactofilin family)
MFRSDKRTNDKQASQDAPSNQTPPAANWQHTTAPPVEPTAPQPQPPDAAAQPPTQPRAINESDAMARDIKEGVLNGFVGNGTVVSGEAAFKGMLRVDGHLTGRISSEDGTLLIGTNGQVDANIRVAVATIHGTVNGDIVATKRIEMGRSAKVVGNIQTPALVIEQGAIFEGGCRMLSTGKEQADERRKEKVKATSPTLVAPTGGLSEVSDISDIAS